MKTNTHTLTDIQLSALSKWAQLHGRLWKSELNAAWMNGNYHGFEDAPSLQLLRNKYGPSWLVRFRFPAASVQSITGETKKYFLNEIESEEGSARDEVVLAYCKEAEFYASFEAALRAITKDYSVKHRFFDALSMRDIYRPCGGKIVSAVWLEDENESMWAIMEATEEYTPAQKDAGAVPA